MSLVVAQSIGPGPWIVSDTHVTYEDGRHTPPSAGTLKAVVVSPDIAVCFAGNVRTGTEAIRHFGRELDSGALVKDLLPLLARETSSGSVEFLIAKNAPGPSLARIRRGEMELDLLTAWIGDADAFERFQQERLRSPEPLDVAAMRHLQPGQMTIRTLQNALQTVIGDATIASVGGFATTIGTYGETPALNYEGSAFTYVGRNFRIDGALALHHLIRPVDEGGYAVCVVEPARAGTPALGLSFPEARLAMVFLPLQFDTAQVLPDVGVDDFVEVMHDRYGVRFAEPLFSAKAKLDEDIFLEGMIVPQNG